jgi:NADP-dependent 3-hydroxy acid dehydrogenase YdfG
VEGIEAKVVAITRATSGIGEATALRLATAGARVVLGARSSGRLDALAKRITNAGGEATYIDTDVRRRDDVESLVGAAREKYGRLDVLVSNAGVMPISPLDDLRVEDWEQMIDVNLKGVLLRHRGGSTYFPRARLRAVRQSRFHSRPFSSCPACRSTREPRPRSE